jgi:amino acid transporter
VIFYLFYKIRWRTKIVPIRDIDLQTGRRELDIRALLKEERLERKKWPKWKVFYRFFC